MGTKQTTPLAKGWVMDASTKLYHYYQEQTGLVAHRPLCDGPVLMTDAVRRRAKELPDGLKPRYAQANQSPTTRQQGICKSCANRQATLQKK